MAAIVECVSQTALTLYFTIHDKTGNVWNGSAFEVYNASNWSTYVNALAEQSPSSYYKATFPSGIVTGKYTFVQYQQVGGSPATTDPTIGVGSIYWNGTIEEQGIQAVLATLKLDILAGLAASGVTPTIGSFIDQIMNKDSGQTFVASADSLQAIASIGGGGPTTAQIAAAVWDLILSGGAHNLGGTGGHMLQQIFNQLPASGVLISSFDPATQKVNLNADQSSVTIGIVNSFGAVALAQIATQIATALGVTTIPELTGAPPSTPTINQALMFIYMGIRNRHTADATSESIFNNAGIVITTASLSDDGTTFVKEQFS